MEVISTFTLLIATIFLSIWLWSKSNYSYWQRQNVETSYYQYFLGSMKDVFFQNDTFSGACMKIYKRYRAKGLKQVGLFFSWVPIYMPMDIDLIKSIMQVDFQHFVDRGIYVNEKNDPSSAHLFSLEGQKWKLLRQKLTPTFTSGKMKMMFETLVDCTKSLRKVMDADMGNQVDIKDILGRYTTDVIGSCAFGLDCNSLENPKSEFREKGKFSLETSFWENIKNVFAFLTPNLMRKLNVKITPDVVTEFFSGVVKDTVEYREKNNITRKDFMQSLIELKNRGKLVDDEKMEAEQITEDRNSITSEEITAQAFGFFLAGFETSSTTLTFLSYESARNREIQEKTRKEIKSVLEKHQGKLTYDATMESQYVEQVINETLRKYPPLPILNRICTKEYRVPGTNSVSEKGVRLMIPVMCIQRDPEYYPDPDKFDPERFSEEKKDEIEPYTFLPFGDGPRACIGTRFGMMQTKVGLAASSLNYDFEVGDITREPLEFDPKSFVLLAKGGIWLTYRRIDKIDL